MFVSTFKSTIVFTIVNVFLICQIGEAQVIINEIDLQNNWIEVYNTSSTQMVDITNYRLCMRPAYDAISSSAVTVLAGSPVLGPGDYVILQWAEINVNENEIGLYLPSGSFGQSTNIVDYVQYGGIASPSRALTAVEAGVWDNVNTFVLLASGNNTLQNFNSAAQSATDTDSNHWYEASATMMADNACPTSYTMLAGSLLFNVEDGNADYETDGVIESIQTITSTAVVDYDSGMGICLNPGFTVDLGATFDAFINGCNLGAGGNHN